MRVVVIIAGVIVVLLLVLSGCGVDGPPQRPSAAATTSNPNVSISGHATVGVITEL